MKSTAAFRTKERGVAQLVFFVRFFVGVPMQEGHFISHAPRFPLFYEASRTEVSLLCQDMV
jgi:hypothetical protein